MNDEKVGRRKKECRSQREKQKKVLADMKSFSIAFSLSLSWHKDCLGEWHQKNPVEEWNGERFIFSRHSEREDCFEQMTYPVEASGKKKKAQYKKKTLLLFNLLKWN
jgi:vacuolar-type H+-ATPase catalytic subunit A/Vma1